MIAVATENNSLLIYQNSSLVWCAELFGETIAFQRGNFSGLSGGLVTLNSTGKVIVGYLGSDPQVFKVPPLNLSKLDYDKSKIELEEMEKEINTSVDNSGKFETINFPYNFSIENPPAHVGNKLNFTSHEFMTLTFFFSPFRTDIPFINAAAERDLQIESYLQFDDINEGEFARLHIRLHSTVALEQIQLALINNPSFVVPQNIFFLIDLPAHEKHSFETAIYSSESQTSELFMPELLVIISFINKQSIPRVLKHTIDIPLKSVLKKSTPQKDGLFKVTLSFSQPLINLGEIFTGEFL